MSRPGLGTVMGPEAILVHRYSFLKIQSDILSLHQIEKLYGTDDCWSILMKISYKRSMSVQVQKVALYKEFYFIVSEGGNMEQFINTFSDTTKKLAETGIIMQDEMLLIVLLSTLKKR
uniref:Uncharacterized protein n=1 Tax=Glossina brevipalpis TaxID=37001 RepID=A0A1A9W8T4_9MUSC